MDLQNRGALKQAAAQRLSDAAYSPRKLLLIHTGAALALNLLMTVLQFILSQQIENTGGLSGMSLRAVLETAQTVLQYASGILLPFWEMGLIFAMLSIARSQHATATALPEGFRRFGPILRLMLLQTLIYVALGILCLQVGSFLYVLTPLSAPLLELMGPAMYEAMTPEQLQQLVESISPDQILDALMPGMLFFGILYLLIAIPVSYRMRLARLVIMDKRGTGALAALRESFVLMRKNCWKLFLLDLSYWWYYVLFLLIGALCYGDILAITFGIPLPFSQDAAFFLFYIASLVCQLALYTLARGKVETTYALVYDTLLNQMETKAPAPKQVPWNYA